MMRALLILALAVLLAGCNGDRIKNSMNAPRSQPQRGVPTRTLGPPSAPAERPAETRRKKAIRTASTSVPPNGRGDGEGQLNISIDFIAKEAPIKAKAK
jgi:hypothetical protein